MKAKRTTKRTVKAAPKKKKATKAAAPKKKLAPKRTKKAAAPTRKKKPAPKKRKVTWIDFVAKHGVVLATARGVVPNLAEAVAGEPIVGSWWSHSKGQQIFDSLSTIDDDVDVHCFKLVDGKVTFVHRRVWPALVRLAKDGVIAADRVASIHQEELETGEHRSFTQPFPEWVPDETAAAAERLTTEQARDQLGAAV